MAKKGTGARYLLFGALFAVAACASPHGAVPVAEGEKLFNDPQFAGSTNDSSCSSCHPGGKGLENAASNPQLLTVINTCITGPLGGQAIAEDSEEMLALKGYIESLGGNE
ncbi:MAG: hypothetical protein ISR54_00115 [Chlorobium phaeobacteroides]|nr:hypothetical protein [Chlorobium phaeobacteroides]MBL6955223.1 hypothetical protein [Chlorobium phaeobacteroides]